MSRTLGNLGAHFESCKSQKLKRRKMLFLRQTYLTYQLPTRASCLGANERVLNTQRRRMKNDKKNECDFGTGLSRSSGHAGSNRKWYRFQTDWAERNATPHLSVLDTRLDVRLDAQCESGGWRPAPSPPAPQVAHDAAFPQPFPLHVPHSQDSFSLWDNTTNFSMKTLGVRIQV